MGSDIRQVMKAFTSAGFLMLFITLAIAWIAFLIFSINPNLDSKDLLSYIVNNYTTTGITGIAVVAIISMAMSTADSYINSSSVLFSNDFCRPLGVFSKYKELFLSRIFAIILGISSIVLAFTSKDLLKIILLANSFYVPIVTPLLFLTILGFEPQVNLY